MSVDGLRPDAITSLGSAALPNFYRFRSEGAFTDNARTDYDYTSTLPNHSSELTGRSVLGLTGHNYSDNGEPGAATLHSNKGSYVASVFDVVHDNGMRTGFFATKAKFVLFDQSYDATNGAADLIGADDGKDKIDAYLYNGNSAAIVAAFVGEMATDPFHYSFLHFHDPDTAGHSGTWDLTPGSGYENSIVDVDGYLGGILDLVENDPTLNGHTTILLTSDHGGVLDTLNHATNDDVGAYTVPFYAWGVGVVSGDLHDLNSGFRSDPGSARPDYSEAVQPIRNGDIGNLGLSLLGLDAIDGSTINADQVMVVPEPRTWGLLAAGGLGFLVTMRNGKRGMASRRRKRLWCEPHWQERT